MGLGKDEIAKYPFLKDAGEYLKDMGFSIEQFGADPDLRDLLDVAYERIKVAADGQIFKSNLIGDMASKDAILPREVFSFLIAIVLLKLCGAHTLIKRFALAESRRAEQYLEKDLKVSSNTSENIFMSHGKQSARNFAVQIVKEIAGIDISKPEEIDEGRYAAGKDEWMVNVSDYLTRAVLFHEREWKLINRKVDNGKVRLPSHQTIRLIRQELGMYIHSKIINGKTPNMIPGFEDHVNRLVQLSKKFATNIVTTGEYPPCIKHAIETLQNGENLPHSGRFMLATFLLSKGQSIAQIAPYFKNAPDYNERITLYQLNNLAGESGSATKYTCPSCEKLRTQDLCFAIPECNNIINPLQFGRKRQ